jgi:hypothetical protein
MPAVKDLTFIGMCTYVRRTCDCLTSRQLRKQELNYPTHDLELEAVVHALKIWRIMSWEPSVKYTRIIRV